MVDVYNIERSEQPYVYRWTDWSNGKYYVGVHNGKDSNYLGSGILFKKAYNKRPWAFTRELLFVGNYDDCIEIEEQLLSFIDAANNNLYYNLSNSASGCSGRKMSDEEKLKRSLALKGVKKSKEARTNMSLAHKHRDKSTYKNGDVTKSVYCEYIDKEFNSVKQLAKELGKSSSYISNMLKGRKNNIYGIKYIYDAR